MKMPVVSQSRFSTASSSSLSTGSFRSTINNSTSADRPFYSSASGSYVSPRSHRNTFTSEYRSYDSDGLRERKCSYSSEYSSRFSRAPSISDSDSAVSTDSRNTRSDRSGSRSRDVSNARSDSGRSSYRSDSTKSNLSFNSSDFYKNYSPNFYTPPVQRISTSSSTSNGDTIRSKSLAGDAARLPLPRRINSTRPIVDDEVKTKTNPSNTSVKRQTNSTHVVKPCVQIECATNLNRLTNDQVKHDIDCAQRQRSFRSSDISSSSSRTTTALIPRAKGQQSWKQTTLSSDFDSSTDDNGNDLRLSVAQIRKKFDSNMSVKHSIEPISLYKTAHSSDNIYSQVRNLNNSVSSLHLDSKPVPVHKPTPVDKYINKATGSLRWEFLSSSKNDDCNDLKGPMISRNSTESIKDVSSVYVTGVSNSERHPINAVKNQLNANNPINKVLEKAKVYVGNGDVSNAIKDKSIDANNILNIEIGNENNSNTKLGYGRHADNIQDKISKIQASDFASYIQVSTPVSSNTHTQFNGDSRISDENNDVVDFAKYSTNDSPGKSISCLLSADEVDGSKLRYIDSEPNSESDNRLVIDYNVKDENNFEEQGFENKTFEHENVHLLRRTIGESNFSVTKPKQNGIDSSELLRTKFKGDDTDSVGGKSHIIQSSEVSSLRSDNVDELSSDGEISSRDEKRVPKGGDIDISSKKSYSEMNGESSSNHHYQNDSGVSRGNSPLSATSACGSLSVSSNSLPRKNSISNTTSDKFSKTSGLNGLRNIGNTCFMNSVVQCLSNTRPLLEYCGNAEAITGDINTTLSCMKGALIKAFSTVICELWREGDSDSVVNTTALKAQIQRFAPRFMGYSQQDAQEFLRYLLEGLHEDVNRVTIKPKPILTEIDDNLSDSQKAQESWNRYLRSEDSRVGDIFVGQLKSSLRCTHCNHISVTFDPFWDLSLPIPCRTGQMKLTQCLSYFTREEELDGDEKPTCSKCQVRRKCVKWFTIQKFPKVLVLHLKRFSPQERFRGKLNVLVEFPLQGLDLSPYAATAKHHEYNLYAVSNHSGTTYSGHYTAYCKHPYNGEWHEYNDSRVSTISPKNVVSSEAYVLFYELSNSSSSSS